VDHSGTPENKEFLRLFEAAGWKRSKVAAMMETDPSTLSRWLTGNIHVTNGTLKLFKSLILLHAPHLISPAVPGQSTEQGLAEWESKYLQSLRDLHEEDRERVLALQESITRHLPKRRLSSSDRPPADHRPEWQQHLDRDQGRSPARVPPPPSPARSAKAPSPVDRAEQRELDAARRSVRHHHPGK